jgi:hypothetical protein
MKILTTGVHTLCLFCLFFLTNSIHGQGVVYPLSNEVGHHALDRLEILHGGNAFFHSSTKAMTRGDAVKYALYLDSSSTVRLSKRDRDDLQYLFDDNNDYLQQPELPKRVGEKNDKNAQIPENRPPQYRTSPKPTFKYFYKTPANLWEYDSKYFDVRINPIINIEYGRNSTDTNAIFLNRRGIDVRGNIDDRVYFQTQILVTQTNPLNYVKQWAEKQSALPGAGFVKRYESNLFGDTLGYDYLLAQGMIGFNATPHIGIQIGHGQYFIGDGMRSLVLSNFGNNYLYMRINTKVWRFHYQNLFAELSSENIFPNAMNSTNRLLDKKYLALHNLSYNILPNLTVGVSEIIMMNRRKYDYQYLNPIIFYRAIEGSIGSPDNVLIAANAKWNLKKRLSFYGQLLFDEFLFKNLFIDNTGWWANKYAVQAGVKYINAFGVDHLDLQFEYNKARPFTYSHYDSTNGYTHSLMPLAHPLGANFREYIFKVRYQPKHRWLIDGRMMYMQVGENSDTNVGFGQDLGNWGNDPLISNTRVATRSTNLSITPNQFGFFTGNGVHADILLASLDASYQFRHNMFFDLRLLYRVKKSDDPQRDQTTSYIGGGIRMNIQNVRAEF